MDSQVETSEETITEAEPAAVSPQLCQRDYRPTPYKQSAWEIVGEVCTERDFIAMSMPIIRRVGPDSDPMFDVFDGPNREAELNEESFVHASAADRAKASDKDVVGASEDELRQLRENFEAEMKEAVDLSFLQGKAAAEAEATAKLEALKTDQATFIRRLSDQWQAMAEQLEKRAIDLATKIAHKILRTTAEAKPEYIIEVIREALKHLGAAQPVRIRVSADDYEFLQVVGVPVDLSAEELGVSYQLDESIKAGCVVETDFGEVDLDLDRMWAQVRDNLFEVSK